MRCINQDILGDLDLPFRVDFMTITKRRTLKRSQELKEIQNRYNNNLVLMEQTHGNRFKEVDGTSSFIYLVDGIWTKNRNTVVGVETADCVPILIYDSSRIGVVHSGWKSTYGNIISKILPLFFNPVVLLGPCIRDCCYDVNTGKGSDNREKLFLLRYGSQSIRREEERTFLNLPFVIKEQINKVSPNAEVIDTSICTCCDPLELPSHYRQRKGRVENLLSTISFLPQNKNGEEKINEGTNEIK